MFHIFAGPICKGFECNLLGIFIYTAAIAGYALSLFLTFMGFKYTVRGFRENKGGLAGVALMILLVGLALLGYMIGQTIAVYTDIEVGQILFDFLF